MRTNNLPRAIKRAFIRATILSLAIVTSIGLFSGNLTGAFSQWVSNAGAADSQDAPLPLIDAQPLPAQEAPQEGIAPETFVATADAATLESLPIDDALGENRYTTGTTLVKPGVMTWMLKVGIMVATPETTSCIEISPT